MVEHLPSMPESLNIISRPITQTMWSYYSIWRSLVSSSSNTEPSSLPRSSPSFITWLHSCQWAYEMRVLSFFGVLTAWEGMWPLGNDDPARSFGWCTTVIPELRQRHENHDFKSQHDLHTEFQANLACILRSCFKQTKKWHRSWNLQDEWTLKGWGMF